MTLTLKDSENNNGATGVGSSSITSLADSSCIDANCRSNERDSFPAVNSPQSRVSLAPEMAEESRREKSSPNKSATKEEEEEDEEWKTVRKDEASQTSPILSDESEASGEEGEERRQVSLFARLILGRFRFHQILYYGNFKCCKVGLFFFFLDASSLCMSVRPSGRSKLKQRE